MIQKLPLLIALVACACASILSQEQRGLEPSRTFLEYRPLGEKRIWTFVANDSAVGQLISVVESQTEINGVQAIEISEELNLDFRPTGTESIQKFTGRHLVSLTGHYLGDVFKVTVNDQTSMLELERTGEILAGFSERGGQKSPIELPQPSNRVAWDHYFLDQLESYLALRGVSVGDDIDDSLFASLAMIPVRIRGTVESFGWMRLFNQKFDSVFVIALDEPQAYRLYYSKDRRLQKVEVPPQNMKAYLDLVAPRQRAEPHDTGISWAQIVKLTPQFGLYLLVTAVVTLFFLRGRIRFGEQYLGLVAGMVVVWLIPITQVPLQEFAVRQWLLPGLKAGQSFFVLGAVPAIIGGLIQGVLMTTAVFFVLSWRGLQQNRALPVGVLCGAGFGFMLACWLTFNTTGSELFEITFMERSFQIAFHVSSGLIISALFCKGVASGIKGAAMLAGVNALFSYFVVFAQQRIVDAGMLAFLLAFIVLATSTWAVLLQGKLSRK